MTFLEYVRTRRRRNWGKTGPAVDFIEAVKADTAMPEPRSWLELGRYLTERGASTDTIEAARSLWDAYMRLPVSRR